MNEITIVKTELSLLEKKTDLSLLEKTTDLSLLEKRHKWCRMYGYAVMALKIIPDRVKAWVIGELQAMVIFL